MTKLFNTDDYSDDDAADWADDKPVARRYTCQYTCPCCPDPEEEEATNADGMPIPAHYIIVGGSAWWRVGPSAIMAAPINADDTVSWDEAVDVDPWDSVEDDADGIGYAEMVRMACGDDGLLRREKQTQCGRHRPGDSARAPTVQGKSNG